MKTILIVASFLLVLGCGGATERDQTQDATEQPQTGKGREDPSQVTRATPRALQPDDWFEDVTERSGVHFTYNNGRSGQQFTLLETLGGGVGLFDYDNDGDLDLFIPGGGQISGPPLKVGGLASALFRNDGDWHFQNVTSEAGLADIPDYSHGCSVTDFDRDGFPDLFLTCYGTSRLYRNQHNGTFRDVTEQSGLAVKGWSTAAAWADVDRDGWADLYVAGYVAGKLDQFEFCGNVEQKIRDVCGPDRYSGVQDRLFHNQQDGTFREVTKRAGLKANGMGLGVVAADINVDGWIDFYVANDLVENHLYLGGPDFQLREVGVESGVAYNEFGSPEASMGVDFGDYNGDGRGDLWVTNFEVEDNSLFQSDGKGQYTKRVAADELSSSCRLFVGFGTGLVDLDNDGWLDIFVSNGHVFYQVGQSPYRQPSFVFRNDSGKRFINVTDKAGPYFSVPHVARGAAAGDLDNDGLLDLVISHQNQPVTLLRNKQSAKNWVRLRLKGTTCDPDAIGAVVTTTYKNRKLTRSVRSGAGYLSQFDMRVILPVDDNRETTSATIRWPGGNLESFSNLAVRQTHELIQSQGTNRQEK